MKPVDLAADGTPNVAVGKREVRLWKIGEVCEHRNLGRQCPICDLENEVEELRSALAQERARGAVGRGLLAEAIDFIPRGTDYLNRLRCRISAEFRDHPPSPAVAALLELAEAAEERHDAAMASAVGLSAEEQTAVAQRRSESWERFIAAVHQWKEVRHGLG